MQELAIQASEMTIYYRNKWLLELKDLIFETVNTKDYAIFLFGSAVNDLYNANDIDIGFLGKNKLTDRVRSEILERLEDSIIPFKVDIVDFKTVEDSFKAIALEEIKIWNLPEGMSLN